ncbi:hypothetical protein Vi05172_g3583 [Venturia inaequalis]|nr:hypothetical protein Vi05172_g3583 [Venturia inaequalis]
MSKPLSLLVTSIGNPAPYANTLHSAGHTLLQSLRLLLSSGSPKPYDPWQPHKGGQISRPPTIMNKRFTLTGYKNVREEYPVLWQSGSYMNVSGPAVKKVWDEFRMEREKVGESVGLIVLCDELERQLGTVRVSVDSKASARGHNGIKSLQQSFTRQKFIRIAVGIGRPLSREPKAVADYVLRKMTPWEKEKIEAAAGQVMSIITDIQYGTYKP